MLTLAKEDGRRPGGADSVELVFAQAQQVEAEAAALVVGWPPLLQTGERANAHSWLRAMIRRLPLSAPALLSGNTAHEQGHTSRGRMALCGYKESFRQGPKGA